MKWEWFRDFYVDRTHWGLGLDIYWDNDLRLMRIQTGPLCIFVGWDKPTEINQIV